MLVPFPLVLLSASVVFDVGLLADNGRRSEIAFWVISAGVRCGLAAKVFGVVGFAHATAPVPTPSAWGLLLSVSVGEPFAASWLSRMDAPGEPSAIAIILSLPGGGLAVMMAGSAASRSNGWAWGVPAGRTSTPPARSPGVRRARDRLRVRDRPTSAEENEEPLSSGFR